MNKLYEAAQNYVQRNISVIPIAPRSKRPIIHWERYQRERPADQELRAWFGTDTARNVGIVTGHISGLIVLDIDGEAGWTTLKGKELPPTPTVKTAKGEHRYFRHPGFAVRNAVRLAPGLDIRGDGGYVVAPPSVHESGHVYCWLIGLDEVPLAEPPAWLVELLTSHPEEQPRPSEGRFFLKGHRNDRLFRLAAGLRTRGLTEDAILAALQAENRARCRPPLPDDEVTRIARSAGRYAPGISAATAITNDIVADYGHAQTLAALLTGRYRWAGHREKWLDFSDGVWHTIEDERMAVVASETLRTHYAEELKSAQERAEIMRCATKAKESCSLARVNGALGFLKGMPGFHTDAASWDADPWLLNLKNGTLDLRSKTFHPHRAEDLCTKQANISYDPAATCPRWLAHLERFIPSADVRRQIQRSLGVALVGEVLEEKLDLWHGTGANGKSTTEKVLLAILGDYAGIAAPNILMDSRQERHPTELADLCGYRLLFSTETEANRRLAEALVKQLTGGEPIKARFLYADFFTFQRTFSLILITNHRPAIAGQDLAIWRRIRLIPWTETIPETERRPQADVVAELVAEAPGILNWMLDGLRDWQRDPHWMAPEVVAATDAYRAEQDALGAFLADCCELGPRYTVAVGTLYEAYTQWAQENSEEPLGKKAFSQNLKARGMGQRKTGHESARHWVGLRMRTDADSSAILYAKKIFARESYGGSVRICPQNDLSPTERHYLKLADGLEQLAEEAGDGADRAGL